MRHIVRLALLNLLLFIALIATPIRGFLSSAETVHAAPRPVPTVVIPAPPAPHRVVPAAPVYHSYGVTTGVHWTICKTHLDWQTMKTVTERDCWGFAVKGSNPAGYTVRTSRSSGGHEITDVRYPYWTPVYSLPGCPAAIARWAATIIPAAQHYGVPVRVVTGIMSIESGGNPTAHNPSGATGLGQFLPGTAASLGFNPWDPIASIYGIARYYAMVGAVAYSGGGYTDSTIYARSCD